MLLKEFDYLSPKITLFYKGLSSHSSIFSGILSLISFSIIFSSGIYFSLELIQKKNPDALYLNRFIEDAGEFPINSSSLFHFIYLRDTDNIKLHEEFDFRSFRIIGFENLHGNYHDKNLDLYDHWIYGICNNESDTEGIGYLIDDDIFKSSACIRKYYNSLEQKYYDTNEKEFRWPILSHGNFNPNSKNYQLIIDKCDDYTLKLILGENYFCKREKEKIEYFSGKWEFYFYFIDQYIDVTNYKKPYTKYFFRIENVLSKDHFSVNNLNFNPTLITTHNGIIFDKIKNEFSYVYDRNDVFVYQTDSSNKNKIYMVYYLWLKNRIFNYERTYRRVQDIISDIGGISEFVTFVATLLNYFYSKYIVLYDTETLLLSSLQEQELINQKNNNNTNNIIKNNEFLKIKDKQQNYESTKSLTSIRQVFEKEKLNNFHLNNNRRNSAKPLVNINTNNNSRDIINIRRMINKKYEYQNEQKIKNIEDKNIKKDKLVRSKIEKFKFNFFIYLYYKINCVKYKRNLRKYKEFRIKVISEESFIRNHFNVYNLIKINEDHLMDFQNKYELKDLINFV